MHMRQRFFCAVPSFGGCTGEVGFFIKHIVIV